VLRRQQKVNTEAIKKLQEGHTDRVDLCQEVFTDLREGIASVDARIANVEGHVKGVDSKLDMAIDILKNGRGGG